MMVITGTPGEVDGGEDPPTAVAMVVTVPIAETSQSQNINSKEK